MMSLRHRTAGKKTGWTSDYKAFLEGKDFLSAKHIAQPKPMAALQCDDGTYLFNLGFFTLSKNKAVVQVLLGKWNRKYILRNNEELSLLSEEEFEKMVVARQRTEQRETFV